MNAGDALGITRHHILPVVSITALQLCTWT